MNRTRLFAPSIRPKSRLRLRLDCLEDRLAPAFTVDDTAEVLTFVADNSNNILVLTANATQVSYQANGGPIIPLTNALPGTLRQIVVQGGTGHDRIDLSGLGATLTAMASQNGGAIVTGGAGSDTIKGTAFNDDIDGGPGSDELSGEAGDDILRARDFESDILQGGTGHDSAYFESSDTVSTVEIYNPFTPAADNQAHKIKVLVLNFDPLIPSQNNQHLYELFPWWNPPQELAEGYKNSLEQASGGYLQFEITGWRNINEIPVFTDGFQYDPDQYYQNRLTNTGWHEGVSADVPRIIREQNVVPLVDAGLVDEVWFFGDHFFAIGGESFMMGPGSFFINGPTYPEVPSSRPFVGYGFSYERAVGEMLHNTGHRTENHGNRTYGGWNLANPQNNWDKFSANVTQSNGVAGVGTTHYPPNAASDYDYSNTTVVQSWADDYLDYPNLPFTPRPMNRESWAHGNPDHHRTYLEWYFGHLPRAAGIGPDGKQANWMKYIWDFDNYEPGGAAKPFRVFAQVDDLFNLGGSEHTFNVAYSSPIPIDVSSIDSADVRVTGPNGFDQMAELVSVSDPSNGTRRVATYRVAALGGTWDAGELGQYTLTLLANQVADSQGAALASQVLGVFRVRSTDAEELPVDADTSLLLRLDNTLTGVGGETSTGSAGLTYEPGMIGAAAHFGAGGYSRYPVTDNISPSAGSVEFWIKPDWNATDPGNHAFFSVGVPFNRSILFQFDDWADWAKLMLWGDDPSTPATETNWERNFVFPIGSWTAGEWHHLAATWDMATRTMSMYVDGQLAASRSDAPIITAFSTTEFAVGGQVNNPSGQPALAAYDEVRISSRARSAGEIAASYQSGLSTDGLEITPNPVALPISDRKQLQATALSGTGVPFNVSTQVAWSSSDTAIATVDGTGLVQAIAAGDVTITATLGSLTATADVSVNDPQRPIATLQPIDAIEQAGGTELFFTVVYSDNSALKASTFDGRDIWVHSANGFSQYATFVSATPSGNGQPRTATYRLLPSGATWDDRDNGTYVVEVMDWQVEDLAGNSVAASVLGQFEVTIGAEPPTDILLSNGTVDENLPGDTEIGTLTAIDPTPGESFTFTLVDDAGGRFWIDGNRVRTTAPLDHEADAEYLIRVRVTDASANSIEKDFAVQINDVNENPFEVRLSNDDVVENSPVGSIVGDLLATDPDAGDTLQLELVAGSGDTDNASFTITNGKLFTNTSLNYELKSSYSIRVRATDAGGLTDETALTVNVLDENPEHPTLDPRPITILPAIPAKATNPAGASVASLVLHSFDEDAPAEVGIAVIGPHQGLGDWQYSSDGANWTTITGTTPDNVLLLARSWHVRFVPTIKFNGFAAFRYRAWDGQTGTPGSTVNPAGTAFAFSSQEELAWIAVGKTRPKVDSLGATFLPPVKEDAKSSKIVKVKDLLGIVGLEQLPSTNQGIALTAAPTTHGTWQYRLFKTRSWIEVGIVSDASPLLLRPTDQMRFLPAANADQAGTLNFRTWDPFTQIVGAGHGLAVLDILPINDAPVLDLSKAAVLNPVDPGHPTDGAPFGSLMSATDIEGADIGVAIIGIRGEGTWEYRPVGGNWTVIERASTGRALFRDADDEVRFTANDDAVPGTASLSFKAWDRTKGAIDIPGPASGKAVSKLTEIITVAIANEQPVLVPIGVTIPSVSSSSGKPSSAVLVKTLMGMANPLSGIAITLADNTNGKWEYWANGRWSDVGVVSPGSALLIADTSKIRFRPTAGYDGPAMLQFKAWDRSAGKAGDRIDTEGALNSFSFDLETVSIDVLP